MVTGSKLDTFFDIIFIELIFIEMVDLVWTLVIKFFDKLLSCPLMINLIKLFILLFLHLIIYLCFRVTIIFLFRVFLCLNIQHSPNVFLI
jgi:hypothetical protein